MKKSILLLVILALSFGTFSCGGGGAGSANNPPGENPGVPSVVELLPSHFIAQTNSNITLHAKVLDGNGAPVPNVAVTFTNLSEPFGVIKSALKLFGISKPRGVLSATVKNTDSSGLATVNISSTTSGFATVQVEVNTGVGIVRDRKTLFFTSSFSLSLQPTLFLDVSSDGVHFNQPGDNTLFKAAGDTQRVVRATVRDKFGLPAFGASVEFGSDAATGVTFTPATATTDANGQASVLVEVSPTILTDLTTVLNITATATLTDNSTAFNLISLFLSPVTIDPARSSVTADPSILSTGGTSNVTAVVITNVGTPAPDGTSVNFSTAPKTASDPLPCGSITPFVQTTGGLTDPPATFTAPLLPGTCTVTAQAAGVPIGSVDILVRTALTVQPATQTVDGIAGGDATYTVFGGVAPYTVASTNPLFAPVPVSVAASGGTFTVTVPANTPTATVTYTIRDATGVTVTATLNISGQALAVLPTAQTVNGAPGGAVTFTIFGGRAPYTVAPSNASPIFAPVPASVAASGDTFIVTVPVNTPATTVTYTIRDTGGAQVTATLTIVFLNTDFFLLPASATIPVAGSVTFTIFGGTEPFDLFVDTPVDVAIFTGGPRDFTVVGINSTTATITVRDADGRQIQGQVTVQ